MPEEAVQQRRSFKYYLDALIFITVLTIIMIMPAFVLSPGTNYLEVTDFPNYYAAGKLLLSGHGQDIYNLKLIGQVEHHFFPGLDERVMPFLMAPAWLIVWPPLALLPAGSAYALWQCLLIVIIVLSSYLLRMLLQLDRRTQMRLMIIMAFSGPVWESIRVGQLSPFLLAALLFASLAQINGKLLAAACWQSLLLVKPHLLLPLLLYQSGGGRYKLVLATAGFGGLAVISSLLLIGPGAEGLIRYIQLLNNSTTAAFMGIQYEPTWRGQLLKLGISADHAAILASGSYLLALIFLTLLGNRFKQHPKFVELSLLIAIPCGLIFALHLHTYDLLLLTPGFTIAYKLRSTGSFSPAVQVSALISIIALMMPVYSSLHYFYVLQNSRINPFFLSLFLYQLLLVRHILLTEKCPIATTSPPTDLSTTDSPP